MTHPHRPGGLIEHVIVVIPAHDEADHIEASLAHLHAAAERVSNRATTDLIVVADDCRDATAKLASRSAGVIVIESAPRCVGLARRIGTEYALSTTTVPTDRVWLASTDADTVVPADWLCLHLDLAQTGAVGVAGIVDIDDRVHHRDLAARFDHHYVLGGDGTHTHVHGANLGVRADAYLNAGGWRPLHTGEDHDLWNRITSVGPTISTTELQVCTSSRLIGRAPHGFADDLKQLAEAS